MHTITVKRECLYYPNEKIETGSERYNFRTNFEGQDFDQISNIYELHCECLFKNSIGNPTRFNVLFYRFSFTTRDAFKKNSNFTNKMQYNNRYNCFWQRRLKKYSILNWR